MSRRSVLLREEPKFLPPRVSHVGSAASWLYEPGSLTLRLRNLCGAGFRVKLLAQHWRKPFFGEARILQARPESHVVTREVVLFGANRPLVVARSLIPARVLRGGHNRIARLGQRPLGEWLFANPGLERLILQFARVERSGWQQEAAVSLHIAEPVWGRRSLYAVGEDQVLVCEFFLSDLFDLERSKRALETG